MKERPKALSASRGGNAMSSAGRVLNPAEPERRTLDRVVGGDLAALAQIYESHAPPAFRTAYRITGSIPDAQDVVQDLFIALPEALASFRGEGSFCRWLKTCAARQALVHLRVRRRRQEIELRLDRPTPLDGTILERIQLEQALDRLPDTLRVVVILRDVEGFSHEDVAKMLRITPSASRMRLMRARQQLRELVGPLTGEAG